MTCRFAYSPQEPGSDVPTLPLVGDDRDGFFVVPGQHADVSLSISIFIETQPFTKPARQRVSFAAQRPDISGTLFRRRLHALVYRISLLAGAILVAIFEFPYALPSPGSRSSARGALYLQIPAW